MATTSDKGSFKSTGHAAGKEQTEQKTSASAPDNTTNTKTTTSTDAQYAGASKGEQFFFNFVYVFTMVCTLVLVLAIMEVAVIVAVAMLGDVAGIIVSLLLLTLYIMSVDKILSAMTFVGNFMRDCTIKAYFWVKDGLSNLFG